MSANKSHVVRIYNSSKQLIQLQVCPPGGDFFVNESQVRVAPGGDVLLPKSHLREDQIENLSKKGFIKVIYDSEDAIEQENAILS